ncbi:type II toxin-antitoxin system YafQ family toxin [Caldicellulosiruptoraceae bacterium PP1]
MNYKIEITTHFEKQLKRLNKNEQKIVYNKLNLLINNPFHPSLRTKKVQGLENVFECRINMDIRLLWQYKNNNIILLLTIGHHNEIF